MSDANLAFLVVSNVWLVAAFLEANKVKSISAMIVGAAWGTVGFFL